jgi:3-deoxy-D-manno-octulosonic-acid transferase
MSIFGFAYDLALHLYMVILLPKIFFHWKKYRGHFSKKLGFNFPRIEKNGRKLIWIHAVSLGETRAVAALVRRLKALTHPPCILLSTSTETGHNEGKRHASDADYHVFLPFDFSYVIKPIVYAAAPDLVVLTETDFWYHFQKFSKKQGASLMLINGKISERSYKRLLRLPFLSKRLLHPIDYFCLQNEFYLERFVNLGISKEKLKVTGNLKLDADLETCDSQALKNELGICHGPVFALGSTHFPEESMWIAALKQIWKKYPSLKVLLAPRHPERFQEIANLLAAEDIAFSFWSKTRSLSHAKILLVDVMGVLKKCYQVCDFVFVGGSFTPKIGGHNLMEPVFYGKPVLFGPCTHSQSDLAANVLAFSAGIQITSDTMLAEVQKLIANPQLTQEIGKNGLSLAASVRGSLEKTFLSLIPLLQKHGSC